MRSWDISHHGCENCNACPCPCHQWQWASCLLTKQPWSLCKRRWGIAHKRVFHNWVHHVNQVVLDTLLLLEESFGRAHVHAFVNLLDGVGNADLTTDVPCGDPDGQQCLSDYVDDPIIIIIIMSIYSIITSPMWHKYIKIEVHTWPFCNSREDYCNDCEVICTTWAWSVTCILHRCWWAHKV